MNIYIFNDVDQLTNNYHPGGGLVVVAESLDQAIALAQADGITSLDVKEIEAVITLKLAHKTPPRVFVFPDAGCC